MGGLSTEGGNVGSMDLDCAVSVIDGDWAILPLVFADRRCKRGMGKTTD